MSRIQNKCLLLDPLNPFSPLECHTNPNRYREKWGSQSQEGSSNTSKDIRVHTRGVSPDWSAFPLAQAAVSFMPVGVQWTSCIITSLGTFLLVDSPWPALCLRSLSWMHRSFVTRRYAGDSPRPPSSAHYWAFVSPDKVPSQQEGLGVK